MSHLILEKRLAAIVDIVGGVLTMIEVGNPVANIILAWITIFAGRLLSVDAPEARRTAARAGGVAFVLYLFYGGLTVGDFQAGVWLAIAFRGAILAALVAGWALVACAVYRFVRNAFYAPLVRRASLLWTAAVAAFRLPFESVRRRRSIEAERVYQAALAQQREEAWRRQQADRAQAAQLDYLRQNRRYDLRVHFNERRHLAALAITKEEFEAMLAESLAPQDAAEIERRAASLTHLLDSCSRAKKSASLEELALDFERRKAEIDQAPYATEFKQKLKNWLNRQQAQELQHFIARGE